MKAKKVIVLIDGSNFYYKLRDKELRIKNLAKFDYIGLAKWLTRGDDLVGCIYYVGAIRAKEDDKRGQKLRSDQQRLFSHLENTNITVERGYLMKHDGTYHEKGVDVKIAIDLVVGAYENRYDRAILISSDTDLIPAIKQARKLGKIVEYIGFAHKPSFGVQKNVDVSRLLIRDELLQFESKSEKKAAKK